MNVDRVRNNVNGMAYQGICSDAGSICSNERVETMYGVWPHAEDEPLNAKNSVEQVEITHLQRIPMIADDSEALFDMNTSSTTEKHATSFLGTVMHMVLLSMSPTLLNLPLIFSQVGYAIGSFGSFSAVLLYTYCMHMIVKSEVALTQKLHKPQMSYADMLYYAFTLGSERVQWLAKYAKFVVRVDFILIWGFGNSIYVIVISQNISRALHFWDVQIDERVLMLYLIVPLVLLCWIPNLRLLAVCSTFSNIVNICSLLTILFEVLQNFPSIHDRQGVGDISKLPLFLGTIFITVNGTGPLLALRHEMKHSEKFDSKLGALNVSFIPAGIFCAVFGFLCSVKYGRETQENVILNLPGNAFNNVVRALYALALVFFYPLGAFVTFDIFWNEILKKKLKTATPLRKMFYKYLVKTANAVGFIITAFVIPDVALFISLTGTICASLDSIIFPAVIEILVFECDKKSIRFKKNILLVLFGSYLTVAGVVDAYVQVRKFY